MLEREWECALDGQRGSPLKGPMRGCSFQAKGCFQARCASQALWAQSTVELQKAEPMEESKTQELKELTAKLQKEGPRMKEPRTKKLRTMDWQMTTASGSLMKQQLDKPLLHVPPKIMRQKHMLTTIAVFPGCLSLARTTMTLNRFKTLFSLLTKSLFHHAPLTLLPSILCMCTVLQIQVTQKHSFSRTTFLQKQSIWRFQANISGSNTCCVRLSSEH